MKDDSSHRKESLEQIAHESLEKFHEIAKAAQQELSPPASHVGGVSASPSGAPDDYVRRIRYAQRQACEALQREPAIARVRVNYHDGRSKVLYICRLAAAVDLPDLASYRSPIGRLVAQPLESQVRTPRGTSASAEERVQYHPVLESKVWDSKDSLIEQIDLDPILIKSLRSLIRDGKIKEIDVLETLLNEEQDQGLIDEHPRREIIRVMGLRDQPVLDQYQDRIFRIPMNNRLLITGPPGTGKTTTLIRRLGQKLDLLSMDDNDDDRALVESVMETTSRPYRDNWIMFTPTELLRNYLKEAFSREGVAASANRVQTWTKFCRQIARQSLGLLSTKSGDGLLILKDRSSSLSEAARAHQTEFFDDFYRLQFEYYRNNLTKSCERLMFGIHKLHDYRGNDIFAQGDMPISRLQASAQSIHDDISRILSSDSVGAEMEVILELDSLAERVHHVESRILSLTNERIDRPLKKKLRVDRDFLDSLGQFVQSLKVPEDSDDPSIEFGNPDKRTVSGRIRQIALTGFRNAFRAYSREKAGRRRVQKTSRSALVMRWILDQGVSAIDEAELELIGHYLLIRSELLNFRNPIDRYISRIANRYLEFRRVRRLEGRWYKLPEGDRQQIRPGQKVGHESNVGPGRSRNLDVDMLELDMVVLAALRSINSLMPFIRRDSTLGNRLQAYREMANEFTFMQVYVDEATDFSPIQLACMLEISHPKLRSFSACGDFNQRLTHWGTKSSKEFSWAVQGIEIDTIGSLYRQSQQLVDLSSMLLTLMGNADLSACPASNVAHSGVSPVMLDQAVDKSVISQWLAQRIMEIQRVVEKVPSIAVFVVSEDDVVPISTALNTALEPYNIRAVGCLDGQVLGDDVDVRCFDVRHIKGLEFEAVFFLDVDKLFSLYSSLAFRYLYVGVTRAATFLGLTFAGSVPEVLAPLRPRFDATFGT